MPRIRSVHPGLFTDEAFVGLSSDAQVFLIGLWVDADDNGIFEWKPLSLRMRLRPTKDGDVTPILAELETAGSIKKFEDGGKFYGACRNFRKWQRPESPSYRHPVPAAIEEFIGVRREAKKSGEKSANDAKSDALIRQELVESGSVRTANLDSPDRKENLIDPQFDEPPHNTPIGLRENSTNCRAEGIGKGRGVEGGSRKKETTSTAARAKDLAENLPDPPKPLPASPPKNPAGSSQTPSPGPDPEVERWRSRILATIGVKPNEVLEKLSMKWTSLHACILDWQGLGADLERHVIPAIVEATTRKPAASISPKYFTPAIQERMAAPKAQAGKSAPPSPSSRHAELAKQRRGRMEIWITCGMWLESWGPEPGQPHSEVTPEGLAKVEADLRQGNRQVITEAQLQAWQTHGRSPENLQAGRQPQGISGA